jgi:hypothetical protein
MADMKHQAPVAGKRGRRQWLQAGFVGLGGLLSGALLSACAEVEREHAARADGMPRVLVPLRTIVGGRIITKSSPTGMPIAQDGFGPMTHFVFPVALAADSFNLYVADAGVRRLYRFDPLVDAMAVVPGVVVTPQTRLALGKDLTLYVASPGVAPLRRYDRGGRLLMEINPQLGAARYDEVAVDRDSGTLFGLDRGFARLEEINPLGRSATLIDDEILAQSPTAIAWDDHQVYVAGAHCACVVALASRMHPRRILATGLRQPSAMAARDGWLVVLDTAERKFVIFNHGELRATPGFETLGLSDPQGIALEGGMLYVADAGGRRVAIFRLLR